MVNFRDIVGHEDVIRHLQHGIETKKLSHSYLVIGETGSGKKTIASTFAMTLQCERGGIEACMECDSCKRAIGNNHPDIITVTHEKPGIITVDEVREQLIHDVAIRPYHSEYKVYIVPDAQFMNQQAQNAILKTIEEPPEYAIIMLLATTAESLLPTIRSRCVQLNLKVVSDQKIKKYLMERLQVPDYQADIDVSFAHGSIGKAKEAATSQEFAEITENALRVLRFADSMEIYELTEVIKKLAAEKVKIEDYLDIFQFWFRDVLMFKATREAGTLVFKQEINYIREQARERSYENIEKILESIDKTKTRLRANVNMELALELLFLTIREK